MWLLYLVIIHTTYIANLLELWLMMDPFGHPHVEGDMVHNSTHYISILDHFNLPTTKAQKIKKIHMENDITSHHIQCGK